jgi:peptidoglycan/xylan/chitin deacetylase (PgdA/CDA1 family)
MQTTKAVFEKQILELKNLGYDFITYEQLQKFKNNEIELKKKSCILSFDDGYKGVYENAYPIAQKYNIPFTMFIITNNMYMDDVISWDNAKEMQDSGLVTIASHSMEHPEFTSLSVEDAVNNVNNSYNIIEEKLGKQSIKIFTYPYGLHKEEQNDALWKE